MAAPRPRFLPTQDVLRLKALLPVQAYIHLLHQGAMTGFLPRFNPAGEPTGQFDNLAPKDRIDLARYLVDKVVPDAPKELALVNAAPPEITAHNVAALPSDELRRIAAMTEDEANASTDPATGTLDAAIESAPVGPARAGAA